MFLEAPTNPNVYLTLNGTVKNELSTQKFLVSRETRAFSQLILKNASLEQVLGGTSDLEGLTAVEKLSNCQLRTDKVLMNGTHPDQSIESNHLATWATFCSMKPILRPENVNEKEIPIFLGKPSIWVSIFENDCARANEWTGYLATITF